MARLLGGTIIIERIFFVPGMGTLLLESITARDYMLIRAIVLVNLVYAVVVLAVNFVIDVIYTYLNSRIHDA